MNKKIITLVLSVSLITSIFVLTPNLISQEQEKTFEADKGDESIDVSSYPELMQKNYDVFFKKCSKCHTLARPINTDFTLEKWERYVKRMMRKPGSGITKSTGKKIYEFLEYYLEAKENKAF